jgi:cytochrome o ubiquinol oxidase operon protein cyoD
MSKQGVVIAQHEVHEATLGKYLTGFVGSLAITLTAYSLATHNIDRFWLITVLSLLAVVQFVVQMVLFLHVGSEPKPRWKLAVMGLMLMVVFILVFGSIFIMDNLNTRMTPEQQQQYVKSQSDL